jgi:hypothetical protein
MSWEWLDPVTQLGGVALGIGGTLIAGMVADRRASSTTDAAHHREDQRDRRVLYGRLFVLDQELVDAWGRRTHGDPHADIDGALGKLRGLAAEIRLIASDETSEAIRVLVEAWQDDRFFRGDHQAQDEAGLSLVPLRKNVMSAMQYELRSR